VRIVFFGTPQFSAHILEDLLSLHAYDIVAVISKPDARCGRGRKIMPTPVKQVAVRHKIPVFQPERASSFLDRLESFRADLFLVVAYGELFSPELLQLPVLGCFNVHASLLPAYRGAAPIQRALMDGAHKTGISIFRLNAHMDSGDLLWQKEYAIDSNMNAGRLTERLLSLAQEGVKESLALLDSGNQRFISQHHEEATLAPKLKAKDRHLDPNQDVIWIHDHVRALSPSPGAFFLIECRDHVMRLKVLQTHIDAQLCDKQRRWQVLNGSLALTTPSGTIFFDIVQLEGRAAMSSEEFLRGIPLHQFRFV